MSLDAVQLAHFPSLARLHKPRVVTTVAWLILLGLVIAVAILFVPWQQTAQGAGQVTTLSANDRAQDVSSLIGGRVDKFFVRDGDYVEKGAPIVRVVNVAAHVRRQVRLGQQQADMAIQFVHIADGGDTQAVLADAAAVAEPGGAGVAGARGNLGQAVAHAGLLILLIDCEVAQLWTASGVPWPLIGARSAVARQSCDAGAQAGRRIAAFHCIQSHTARRRPA